MDSRQTFPENPFSVIRTVLASGERLPFLVESTSWIPTRIATRWAVRYRRYRVQASTLAGNLRIIGLLYNWATTVAQLNLDDFLTQGNRLDARQIESFAFYLRNRGIPVVRSISPEAHLIIPSDFDHQLSIVEDFLKWSLDQRNRGGSGILTIEELSRHRTYLTELFNSLRVGTHASQPQQPLSEEDLKIIRQAIGPVKEGNGSLTFPRPMFSKGVRLRNWVMFETSLELGLRRGELLKMRLDSLPRGSSDIIRVIRRPDDPADSRLVEPAVKTAERLIPATPYLLSILRAYLTIPPPLGRVTGKSPYLFVTREGNPVSIPTADDIAKKIRAITGVDITWHRLRHTWAEKQADRLAKDPNGMDQLQYLGGWTNETSPKRYIKQALAKLGIQSFREHQNNLYSEE